MKLALVLSMILQLSFPSAFAATGSACPTNSTSPGTLNQYCQAQDTATTGSTAHNMAKTVWTMVATVCMASCLNHSEDLSKKLTSTPCGQSNLAAGASEAIAAKDIGSMFSSAKEVVGADAPAPAPSTDAKPSGAKASCNAAISASQKALAHGQQADANQNAATADAASAQNLTGNESATAPIQAVSVVAKNDTAPSMTSAASAAGSAFSPGGVCASAKTSGNAAAYIQCASQADSTLPNSVNTPGFQNDFKAVSGIPLSQFLAQDSKPSQAVAAALGSGSAVTPAEALKAGESIAELENQMLNSGTAEASATYSGGRSIRKTQGSPDDSALADAMSGLLGKINGKGDDSLPGGSNWIVFSNAYRSPATVANNPALSIFDRVSFRYTLVRGRLQ